MCALIKLGSYISLDLSIGLVLSWIFNSITPLFACQNVLVHCAMKEFRRDCHYIKRQQLRCNFMLVIANFLYFNIIYIIRTFRLVLSRPKANSPETDSLVRGDGLHKKANIYYYLERGGIDKIYLGGFASSFNDWSFVPKKISLKSNSILNTSLQ